MYLIKPYFYYVCICLPPGIRIYIIRSSSKNHGTAVVYIACVYHMYIQGAREESPPPAPHRGGAGGSCVMSVCVCCRPIYFGHRAVPR